MRIDKRKKIVLPTLQKGLYRHSKTGNLYKVIDFALHTETDNMLVLYEPQYKTDGYRLFARPYDMFTESIELNGEIVPRFQKIEDD